MARPQINFTSIEAGRGLAALLVVLYHASASTFMSPKYWNTQVFGGFFDFGYAGVEFFFVLSGFIITHVHSHDIGQPSRLATYARRRLMRIYPVYWLVLAAMMTLAVLPLGLGPKVDDPMIYASAIFLAGPDNLTPWIGAAWTLFHEMLFYTVFAVWIMSRRAGLAVAALWLAAVGAGLLGMAGLPDYVMSPLNLLFGFGVAACWLSNDNRVGSPHVWAAAGTIGFFSLGLEAVYLDWLAPMPRNLLFGLASAIGIAGVTTIERSRKMAVPRLLVRLGAASYAIYLTHFALLSFLAKIAGWRGLRAHLPPALAFVILVVLVVVLGMIFHSLVELPLRRSLGRRWRQVPPPVSTSRDATV